MEDRAELEAKIAKFQQEIKALEAEIAAEEASEEKTVFTNIRIAEAMQAIDKNRDRIKNLTRRLHGESIHTAEQTAQIEQMEDFFRSLDSGEYDNL